MNRKNLILVGAGDAGREMLAWLSSQTNDFTFKGFIDDIQSGNDVIGTIQDYQPQKDDIFACSVGTPTLKMELVASLEKRGATFVNLIHQSAIILSPIDEVRGLVIAPFVYIANNVSLGHFVFANVSATIGHDVVVGDGSTLSAHSDLTGHVTLGKRVFLGSHACIIPGKIIGDDAIIGAGSAVMRNVPAGSTVIGVPAKKLL